MKLAGRSDDRAEVSSVASDFFSGDALVTALFNQGKYPEMRGRRLLPLEVLEGMVTDLLARAG